MGKISRLAFCGIMSQKKNGITIVTFFFQVFIVAKILPPQVLCICSSLYLECSFFSLSLLLSFFIGQVTEGYFDLLFDFLSLECLSCDTNPLHVHHPSWNLDKGSRWEHEDKPPAVPLAWKPSFFYNIHDIVVG